MAPFKLKFRMGGSRSASTSQEHDPDPTVNEALLGAQQQETEHHHQQQQQQQQQHQHQQQQQQQLQQQQQQQQLQAVGASSSTIDSVDCNSLGSMSERKLLLPPNSSKGGNNTNSLRMGYVNQSRIDEQPADSNTLPTTPPPTYEYVLEENTRLSQHQQQQQHQRQLSTENSVTPNQNSRRSSRQSTILEQLNLNDSHNISNSNSNNENSDCDSDINDICNDPDCQQNYNNSSNSNGCLSRGNNNSININNNLGEDLEQLSHNSHIIEGVSELQLHSDHHEEGTLSVNEFLLESEMAEARAKEQQQQQQHHLFSACSDASDGPCTDEQCTQCAEQTACSNGQLGIESEEDGEEPSTSNAARHNFYDPLLNRYGNESGCASSNSNGQVCNEACCASGSLSGSVASRSRRGHRQLHSQQEENCLLTPEMMSNKTSKEIYKDLAKQWGITCKMSESCRCMDCQSHYFDCDYDDNEHQKTDGGLGAGTPMFISEVMHGSGCQIL